MIYLCRDEEEQRGNKEEEKEEVVVVTHNNDSETFNGHCVSRRTMRRVMSRSVEVCPAVLESPTSNKRGFRQHGSEAFQEVRSILGHGGRCIVSLDFIIVLRFLN